MTDPTEFDIRSLLPETVDARVALLQVLHEVDSSNDFLMKLEPPAPGTWHVVLAHEQTAGRGRGSRQWHSPPGGLWMSAAYTFHGALANPSALTLALGTVVAGVLRAAGVDDIGLKWPNDLVAGGGKLGGILTESVSPGRTVVCGVGINLHTASIGELGPVSALPPVGLAAFVDAPPSRAELAAQIVRGFAGAVARYAAEGFSPFRAEYERVDWLHGREIIVTGTEPELPGTAAGIREDGALNLLMSGREIAVYSGSVRLRAPAQGR